MWTPTQRTTWGTHALNGWYVGPAMQHYRCYKFWIPETRGFRIAQTAIFFPTHTKMPEISRQAKILLSAKALTSALLVKDDKNPLHPPINKALEDLANIFIRAAIPGDPTAPHKTRPIQMSSKQITFHTRE